MTGEITPKPLAKDLFQKFLKENNIEVSIGTPNVRSVNGGGLVVDSPPLIIVYKNGGSKKT